MLYLFVGLCILYVLWVRRHLALCLVALSSVTSAGTVLGCTTVPELPPQVAKDRIRKVRDQY